MSETENQHPTHGMSETENQFQIYNMSEIENQLPALFKEIHLSILVRY